ncbi:MAG: hypothetical protein JW850_10920 [Thermoflexales bacterium]|nr:hypothetical protein [Thermoflexales bacterium]
MSTDTSRAATPGCESCPMRAKAEAKPNTWWARLWRWHTTWCPGWKAYQKYLAEQKAETRS